MQIFGLLTLLAGAISFDAASVKPSAPQPNGQHGVTMRGGPETSDLCSASPATYSLFKYPARPG
jgi:hypothetical protein